MLDVRRLDPSALNSILHHSVTVDGVEVVGRAQCGDGVASTADRLTLRLDYSGSSGDELPQQVILKTLLLHPIFRFGLPVILTLSSAAHAAERLPLVGAAARRQHERELLDEYLTQLSENGVAQPLTLVQIAICRRFFVRQLPVCPSPCIMGSFSLEGEGQDEGDGMAHSTRQEALKFVDIV